MLNAPLTFQPFKLDFRKLELDFQTLNLDILARVHDTTPHHERLTDDAHPSLLLFFDAFFDHAFLFLFLSMHLAVALPTQKEMPTQCKMTAQERTTTQYKTDV